MILLEYNIDIINFHLVPCYSFKYMKNNLCGDGIELKIINNDYNYNTIKKIINTHINKLTILHDNYIRYIYSCNIKKVTYNKFIIILIEYTYYKRSDDKEKIRLLKLNKLWK